MEAVVPLAWPLGFGDEVLAGGGAFMGAALVERGPVGGARSVGVFERGLRGGMGLEARGGVRVRVRVEVWSCRGERERRDAGSSVATVSQSTLLPSHAVGMEYTNLAAICASPDSDSVPYSSYPSLLRLALRLYVSALLFLGSSSALYGTSRAGLETDSFLAASLWIWTCIFAHRGRDAGLYHLAFYPCRRCRS